MTRNCSSAMNAIGKRETSQHSLPEQYVSLGVTICIVVHHLCPKHQMEIGAVNYVVLVMDKIVLESLFLHVFDLIIIHLCLYFPCFNANNTSTIAICCTCTCTDQHLFQMFTVRFLGRGVRAFDRRTTLRVLTGLASGGCALTVAWKYGRLHAATAPVPIRPIPTIVQEEKTKTVAVDKFDWNLFWYYLKPQVWIIACATAVGDISFQFERENRRGFLRFRQHWSSLI